MNLNKYISVKYTKMKRGTKQEKEGHVAQCVGTNAIEEKNWITQFYLALNTFNVFHKYMY